MLDTFPRPIKAPARLVLSRIYAALLQGHYPRQELREIVDAVIAGEEAPEYVDPRASSPDPIDRTEARLAAIERKRKAAESE